MTQEYICKKLIKNFFIMKIYIYATMQFLHAKIRQHQLVNLISQKEECCSNETISSVDRE